MQVKGILKVKGERQKISDKFTKRDFVLTENSTQYPQYLSIQLTQDKCDLLDNINVGDMIEVSINLRGREWVSPQNETKYFNTIEAWKITKDQPQQYNQSQQSAPVQAPLNNTESDEDGLPF